MSTTGRRLRTVTIRVKSEEKDRLQIEAGRLNVSISDIIRMSLGVYFSGGQQGPVGSHVGKSLKLSDVFGAPPSEPADQQAVNGLGGMRTTDRGRHNGVGRGRCVWVVPNLRWGSR